MSSKIVTWVLSFLIVISLINLLGPAPGLTVFLKLIPGILAFTMGLLLRKKIFSILAGVCIILTIIQSIFYIMIIEPSTKRHLQLEQVNTIEYNLLIVGRSLYRYANDNNGHLPLADKWNDLLLAYDNSHDKRLSKLNFQNPKIKGSTIAFNRNLGGKDVADIPRNTVLLFEAQGDWNLTGDEYLAQISNPDRNSICILLVGSFGYDVKSYWIQEKGIKSSWLPRTFESVRWKP